MPKKTDDTTQLRSENQRLETVVLAQQKQQGRCWVFLGRLCERLEETDPEGAEIVRAFLQDEKLWGDLKAKEREAA